MVVVLEAATSQALTELATIKRELTLADGQEDSFLEQAIAQASALVSSHCGRVFGRELLEETHDGLEPPTGALVLQRWPVRRVAEIEEDGRLLAGPDWRLDARAGLLWRVGGGRRLRWGRQLRVVYEAGWLLPGTGGLRDLPSDLERATLELAKAFWFGRERDPRALQEASSEVYQASYHGDLPPIVLQLLAPYRARRA